MLIRVPPGWAMPDSSATPEALVLGRRAGLRRLGAIATGLALSPASSAMAADQGPFAPPRNPAYPAGREITAEREATTYNNYYEFGTDKGIWRGAQKLPQRPWVLQVDGLVDAPRSFDIDDLLRSMPLEERVYRLRCVEAWSMVVPWTGFPLAALLKTVGVKAGARFLRFETAALPAVMPGLRQSWYPWPYVEGCTLEEAGNDLSFLAVGAYGKALPPQNGGPLRLHQPWKYGFKAGKSLVRITLTDQRPKSFWEEIQPQEYGFWANVNPAVGHPRWSQAQERVLGSGERIPTQLFNGYGEWVAGLYSQLQKERLWT